MRTSRSEFYSDMWRRAAEATGAYLRQLPDGGIEINRDGRSLSVHDNVTSLDAPDTVRLANNKPMTRALLARSGIPVPWQIAVGSGEFDKALLMLRSSALPLVVKPAEDTSGGAGVSTNVTTEPRLTAAFACALSYGRQVAIEEQVEGDCYRCLVMDGNVLDVILRRPPTVVGDGASSIRQLVHSENKLRLKIGAPRAQVLIRHDPDLHNTLASQGLRLRSRPARGRAVVLKRVVNDNGGVQNVPANGELCPAILNVVLEAAKIVGARLAGVDVICSDPKQPLESSGGVVIEVNTAPGLYYHYHRADSSHPVADRVLEMFFDRNGHHGAK